MKKILTSLFLVLTLGLCLVGCGDTSEQPKDDSNKPEATASDVQKDSLEKIKERGTLILGTTADYPPCEFHMIDGGSDEIVGMDIDIAKAVAEKLGVELEIEDMDFGLLIGSLQKGTIDMVLAGLTKNPERLKEIDMSSPYYSSTQSILTLKDKVGEFKDEDSLKGKKIGVQMGSIQEEFAKKIEGADVTSLGLITALLAQLQTGDVDCIVMETVVADQYAKNNPDFAVAPVKYESEDGGYSIGIQKGNESLMKVVEETIKELKDNGSIDKFLVKATELSDKEAK